MNHPAQPAPEGAKRRPILMGQAIEIPNPNITPEVQSVLDNEGLYIGGDSKAPDHVIIPLWSQDGIVHSMKLDAPLDPERFLETVTFKGPYTPQSASPQDSAALRAENDQMRVALECGQQNCDDTYNDLRAERDSARQAKIVALVECDKLRARCERLEGALRQTIDRCARVELGAPSYHLANDLANVLRAVLAQPEDGK